MKTSELTKEEILEKHTKDSQWYAPVCDARILQAMQEYAESYHKEKLKNDLISFAGHRNEQHFLDWESKYMISVNEINDFLNTKE